MKLYICTEGFSIDLVDDDGFFTGKYDEVQKGSLWELQEVDYRMVGGSDSVRLNGVGPANGMWLEITKERLEMYFEEVEPMDPNEIAEKW